MSNIPGESQQLSTGLTARLAWLKAATARNMFTLAALGIVLGLLYFVRQLAYAFWDQGLAIDSAMPLESRVLRAILILFTVVLVVFQVGVSFSLAYGRNTPPSANPLGEAAAVPRRRWFTWIGRTLDWPAYVARSFGKWVQGLAIVMLIAGVIAIRTGWRGPPSYGWYLLSGGATYAFGFAFLAGGVAILLHEWMRRRRGGELSDDLEFHFERFGRLFAWIIGSYVLGELIWLAACGIPCISPQLGFVLYAQWAVIQFVFLLINAAVVLDRLDAHTPIPFRLFGAIGAVIVAFWAIWPAAMNLETPAAVPVAGRPTSPTAEESLSEAAATLAEDLVLDEDSLWFQLLNQRLDAMPDGPVILVAASGGGSRAAIFTMLVLEGLARTPTFSELEAGSEAPTLEPVSKSLADHVRMISSVSGGSLATASFVTNGGSGMPGGYDLQHTNRGELEAIILNEMQGKNGARRTSSGALEGERKETLLSKAYTLENPKMREAVTDRREARTAIASEIEAMKSSGTSPAGLWPLSSGGVDEMSIDFMAPILRGVLTPVVSRGDALERFWETRFKWEKVDNRKPLGSTGKPGDSPLVMFNVCLTGSGSRYVISFPPTPKGVFAVAANDWHIQIHSLEEQRIISLAKAVRASSNFPWGFGVRTTENARLSDGGMVDNTGVDTLYRMLNRLDRSTAGAKILKKMADRGVVLLEIDADNIPGANRSDPLLEPLGAYVAAVTNRSHESVDLYWKAMNALFRKHDADFALNTWSQDVSSESDIQRIHEGRFLRYPFQFNGSGVMTAWALSTSEKAQLTSNYLVEERLFHQHIRKYLKTLATLDHLRDNSLELSELNSFQEGLAEVALAATVAPEWTGEPGGNHGEQAFNWPAQWGQLKTTLDKLKNPPASVGYNRLNSGGVEWARIGEIASGFERVGSETDFHAVEKMSTEITVVAEWSANLNEPVALKSQMVKNNVRALEQEALQAATEQQRAVQQKAILARRLAIEDSEQ